jgi:hypothetical protein
MGRAGPGGLGLERVRLESESLRLILKSAVSAESRAFK